MDSQSGAVGRDGPTYFHVGKATFSQQERMRLPRHCEVFFSFLLWLISRDLWTISTEALRQARRYLYYPIFASTTPPPPFFFLANHEICCREVGCLPKECWTHIILANSNGRNRSVVRRLPPGSECRKCQRLIQIQQFRTVS